MLDLRVWISSIVLVLGPIGLAGWAQTPLDVVHYSSDVLGTFSSTLLHDEEVGTDDLVGIVNAQSLGLPASSDLIAFHQVDPGLVLFSTDISLLLGGMLVRPGDVIQFDGGSYSVAFDATAAGVPPAVKVDALTSDGSDLLLSFDTSLLLAGVLIADEDVVRFNGATFNLEFDGTAAGISGGLDLDGVHRLANGNLLLSFDGAGIVDGVVFADEDLLEFSPGPQTWTLAYDGSAAQADWEHGDLDALFAVPGANPGSLQFASSTYFTTEAAAFALVTVKRVVGSDGAVSVTYSTSDGTATQGTDYQATNGVLLWGAGDLTNRTFLIGLVHDSTAEPLETVSLNLGNPTGGATLGVPSSATLFIGDDDMLGPPVGAPAAGVLRFSQPSYTRSETGVMATITVERVGGSAGMVSVNYLTSDGSATAGLDYTVVGGTLSWGDGVTTDQSFNVPILDDALPEGDEVVILSLSDISGGAVLQQPNPAALIIQDDEQPSRRPELVPTLTGWSLFGLALLLAGLGVRRLMTSTSI